MTIDIKDGQPGPAGILSNFAPHDFVIDGVKCASMEGFLQSLKFFELDEQLRVCRLVGLEAKRAGHSQLWQASQCLFWQGWYYPRHDAHYQILLDRAFEALAKNTTFSQALKATDKEELDHTIGNDDPHITVLTRQEFISRLDRLRARL